VTSSSLSIAGWSIMLRDLSLWFWHTQVDSNTDNNV